MKLDIYRKIFGPKSTPGKLSVDAQYFCHTLELSWLDNAENVSCIPAGIYPVTVNMSAAHGKRMPEILDVPNRSGVRFDIANYPHQLLGCVAVGMECGTDMVAGSTAAWLDLYQKIDNALKSGDTVTLEIHDPEVAVQSTT